MGNKASTEKTGFYTSSNTHRKTIHTLKQIPILSPKESNDDNIPQYSLQSFDHKISAILTQIENDLDPGSPTLILMNSSSSAMLSPNTGSQTPSNSDKYSTEATARTPKQEDTEPDLQWLNSISSVNSKDFASINVSSSSSKKVSHGKRQRYEHIKLDFVKPENYLQRISSVFTYHKQLGCGASCRVLLVNENKNKSKLYALKEMQISDELNRLLFATEYKILNILAGHRNIISYHSSYIDKYCYYLSTAYCSGGTMLDRIIKQGHFNEKQCSEFMKEVLIGVKYMHDNKIVHRDIKCENLIFDKPGKDGIVKIIDFGNSEMITNPKEIDKIIVGTLHYLPPEMVSGKAQIKEELYKGDMWAVGVVCYVLVSGKVPFHGKNQNETLKCIKKGIFSWPKNVKLSNSCRDFIWSLLNTDIETRLTATEALKHPWISHKDKASETDFGDDHLNRIQLFSTANKLQRILINAILSEMDKTEKKILLSALRDLDMNGTGRIHENDIINYILMHYGGAKDKQFDAETKAKKFMTHVKQLSSCDLLKDQNKNGDNEDPEESEIMHVSFHDIDIDQLLDTIDKDINDIEDEKDEKDYESENMMDALPLLLTRTESEISVDRFQRIMSHADKEYDINELIKALSPKPNGKIPLINIHSFNKPFHSRQSAMNSQRSTSLSSLDTASDDHD